MDLLTSRDAGVLTVTLNRPEHGNGMSDDMARDLTRTLLAAPADARLVVLRGNGPDFCTGRAAMGARPPASAEALSRRRDYDVIFDCYGAFRDCTLPIVGVVQGRALGLGCALAALCDVTLASDAATFQVPEMNHKILPTMVMSALVDRVSRKPMQYLVYSRAIISAQRALDIDIVSEIAPAGELEARLTQLLASLLAVPDAALLGVKEFARAAYDMPVAGAVGFARNLHATINSSSSQMR